MEPKITLKKENVLRVGIDDENGKDTGNYLEFDLEDIELPLKWQMVGENHKKNLNYLRMQFSLIDKKPDIKGKNRKGKKMLSSREEEKLLVLKEFYRREIETLDVILGKGGTAKLLNGRNPYYQMFTDIMGYLEPLTPYLEQGFKNAKEMIIQKYEIQDTDTMVA